MRRCLQCGASFGGDAWRCPRCGHEPRLVAGFPAFAPELAAGASGYDPGHFVQLAELEARHFWFRARNRLIAWALARYFPRARTFLEAGCGTGFVLCGLAAAFPRLALTGGEAAVQGLEIAARRAPGARLIQMDAGRIPFREEFDAAGAFDVIEHVEDDRAVLGALREALVPGGGLLVTVPQHPFLWSEYDARAGHVRRYRRRELRARLLESGFEIVTMTSFVTLLLPLMYASRLAQRLPRAGYDPLAELRIAPWLGAVLERALAIERLLIRAGISLPAGGSLLAVARRPRNRDER
ncbi:MAG TPA: methyltransferase domain-containing protein [Burkholderiales bacterium]|nr:methyltransferase domain-containing protein [Burkholderiales bacterium]